MALVENSPVTVFFEEATPNRPSGPQRFIFTGSGSEYFRIWIVNLLLSLLTLGIYSAWAKVRRMRYFYDNTLLASSSFEYHGKPASILRGRVIAVLFVTAYNIAFKVSPEAGLAMLVILGMLVPWLVWKSLQFKLHNSSYRGIRFGFRGNAPRVYFIYLLLPLLTLLSAYLLAPFTHQRTKKFQHEESRYGSTPFSFHAGAVSFYKAYLLAFAVAAAGVALIGAGFSTTLIGIVKAGGIRHAGPSAVPMVVAFILAIYAWIFSVIPVFLTLTQNLIWNNTRLGPHRFQCHMKIGRMLFITMTNLVGVIITLGLFIPFAQVRMMKYRIESMSLYPVGSLDDFIAETHADAGATGEGMADLLDFDLSL